MISAASGPIRRPRRGSSSTQSFQAARRCPRCYFKAEQIRGCGDTVLIGASFDDIGGNADQGAAYVFVRNGATWTQQQKLIASDGAAYDYFGSVVAISGDTVLIGAAWDHIYRIVVN